MRCGSIAGCRFRASEPLLRGENRRRHTSRQRACATLYLGVKRLAPQVELGARVDAHVLVPRRLVLSRRSRLVLDDELERALVHPHPCHLLVRHGHTVRHESRPSRRIGRAIVCRRSEKLHAGRAVPRQARALADRAFEQNVLASRHRSRLRPRWSVGGCGVGRSVGSRCRRGGGCEGGLVVGGQTHRSRRLPEADDGSEIGPRRGPVQYWA